jgi:hypothetical protein
VPTLPRGVPHGQKILGTAIFMPPQDGFVQSSQVDSAGGFWPLFLMAELRGVKDLN